MRFKELFEGIFSQTHICKRGKTFEEDEGWMDERYIDFSSETVNSRRRAWGKAWGEGILWIILLKRWMELMCTLLLARHEHWDASSPFLPHLISHFNNVCIWQKTFWRHENCAGEILEYKEEFVPSDQETRKCLEDSNIGNLGMQIISSLIIKELLVPVLMVFSECCIVINKQIKVLKLLKDILNQCLSIQTA